MKIVDYDSLLNIYTTNSRNWDASITHFNRLEPTSYNVLNLLFQHLEVTEKDNFVDFGSGNGRVLFYVHYRYQIPVTGIELHPITFIELEENKKHYLSKNYNKKAINLYQINALDYEIKKQDSIFYFFNPFSVVIYKKVFTNIMKSLTTHPRKVQIIIYYPNNQLIDFLNNHTPFRLNKKVDIEWSYDAMDHILIYDNSFVRSSYD